MTQDEITGYLTELDHELAEIDVVGEICIYGGAAMCLAFKARPSTKDVDAIFAPVKAIRNAARKIAERHSLNIDWLNFAVKMFVVDHERTVLFDFPNLKVYVPPPDYLLAMKILALRAESFDVDDVRYLTRELGVNSVEELTEIVASYYPYKVIAPEKIFQLEEIIEGRK
jgi:hypothetical protein